MPNVAILETSLVEMGGHTILSFVVWDSWLLTCDLVSGWHLPFQFPLLGGLTTYRISVMVVPGFVYPWVCHGFSIWLIWTMRPPLYWRLLVIQFRRA